MAFALDVARSSNTGSAAAVGCALAFARSCSSGSAAAVGGALAFAFAVAFVLPVAQEEAAKLPLPLLQTGC